MCQSFIGDPLPAVYAVELFQMVDQRKGYLDELCRPGSSDGRVLSV